MAWGITYVGESWDLRDRDTFTYPSRYLVSEELCCFEVSFSVEAEWTFYALTNDYVWAYIAESDDVDWNTGKPVYIVESFEPSRARNIAFSATLEEARTYYFFIRLAETGTSASSNITVTCRTDVQPTQQWDVDDWSNSISDGDTIDFPPGDPAAYTLSCGALTFNSTDTFTISTNTSTALYAYISSTDGYDPDNGEPTGTIYDSDTSSSGGFSLTFTPDSTSRTYYLFIRTASGSSNPSRFTVEFSTGGGGGGWQLIEERAGTVSSSFDFTYNNGFEAMKLYRMSITFSQNATVTFSTSGNADTMGWLSDYSQTTWDSTNGDPDNYLVFDDDHGSGSNFELSYSCTAGDVYYLWYRTNGTSGYSGSITLSVDIGSTPSQWSYVAVSGYSNLFAQTSKAITVSSLTGQYFGVSFANSGTATISVPSGANLDLFVTDANYGYDTADGYPYTYSGKATSSLTQNVSVTSGTTYYVWVKGSTASVTGGINVTLTPPTPSQTWTYTLGLSITNPSSTVTRSYTLTAGNGYYLAVQFSTAGTAVFYTEGSGDDIGYLTLSDSGYDSSTGVPNNVVARDDDSGTDSNFRIEYSVAANTTYYLWFRMYNSGSTGSVTLYVVPPAQPTGGYIRIYIGGSWVRAKPMIYMGSSRGWEPATARIYSGGWQPTI